MYEDGRPICVLVHLHCRRRRQIVDHLLVKILIRLEVVQALIERHNGLEAIAVRRLITLGGGPVDGCIHGARALVLLDGSLSGLAALVPRGHL